MGLQLIIKAERNKIEKALGALTSECEIFPVAEGLSVFLFRSEVSYLRVKLPF